MPLSSIVNTLPILLESGKVSDFYLLKFFKNAKRIKTLKMRFYYFIKTFVNVYYILRES